MYFSWLAAAPNATWFLSLDERCYQLDDDEKLFFKRESGIQDDEELRRDIISVQIKAFTVRTLAIARILPLKVLKNHRLKLGRLPAYTRLLKLGRERKDGIFVDIGCCFGNDVRKAVQDGFLVENTLATDLRRGHEMFKSTPQTFPTLFVEGDILKLEFLMPVIPFTKENPPTTSDPSLNKITSLNALRGHVSAIFTGAYFHPFNEEQQELIARKLAGGISSSKGTWGPTGHDYQMFCYSSQSWKELWEGIFGKGNIEVEARVRKEVGGDSFFDMYPGNKDPYHVTEWSVTRV
ncbi:hypothetical protein FB446DRAFT_767477 [Lentinula raphanica]|nr:hypothetical protein FB446DRAFT_767477 [Lentinula raphanica]